MGASAEERCVRSGTAGAGATLCRRFMRLRRRCVGFWRAQAGRAEQRAAIETQLRRVAKLRCASERGGKQGTRLKRRDVAEAENLKLREHAALLEEKVCRIREGIALQRRNPGVAGMALLSRAPRGGRTRQHEREDDERCDEAAAAGAVRAGLRREGPKTAPSGHRQGTGTEKLSALRARGDAAAMRACAGAPVGPAAAAGAAGRAAAAPGAAAAQPPV